jgi:hypothetical protein
LNQESFNAAHVKSVAQRQRMHTMTTIPRRSLFGGFVDIIILSITPRPMSNGHVAHDK